MIGGEKTDGTKMKARFWATLAAALVGLAVTVPSAGAAGFEIEAFDGEVSDGAGHAYTQAGGHPASANSTIELGERVPDPMLGVAMPVQMQRSVTVELPPGLVGNPGATNRCTRQQLLDGANNGGSCPLDTQVGLIRLDSGPGYLWAPLYNMEPPAGSPVAFGFNFDSAPVMITASVRTGTDYGINLESRNISQAAPILGEKVILWGNPAGQENDPLRFGQEGPERRACLSEEELGEFPTSVSDECHVNGPEVALVTNPTACTAPGVGLETRLEAESWQGEVDHGAFFSHEPPGYPTPAESRGPQVGPTGCGNVPFTPTIHVVPSSPVAGSPTGLSVNLAIPQDGILNPRGLASSALKDATVELPAGMAVNASSASGLAGCTPDEVGLTSAVGASPITFTPAVARCPESSKIGSVRLETPLLEEPLEGGVYLASQGTNPFNSLLALYIAVDDPKTGVVVKLPGKISPDPSTGRLTATFDENPQLPFESLSMQLKGGDRAPLVNPPTCGTYSTQTALTGWARPNAPFVSNSSFSISQGCGAASRFTPSFQAGTTNPVGGSYSPFMLRVTRPDGQANVSSLEATLPEGLLAKLAGVPLCGDAQASTGDCPAASQVGSTVVGAGAGASPIYVPQPGRAPTAVYLAGPYRGAPYSLVVKVPAQAGPFDLGTVTVRNALYVNEVTAQVTAKSDPLPQILMGIPISYRDIRVEVNRPEFTVNPTSCDPMEVTSTIRSASGQTASPSSRFQAASCASLGFQPKLALALKGRTNRTGHPALKATLTFPQEGRFANIRRAQVGLPHSLFLDQDNIGTVCKQADLRAGTCPTASIYGRARAWTPLLDRPLEGPVYLGVGYGHKLPDLVADLDGQLRILLNGKVDTTKQKGLRNTFEAVPDAPVSRFTLELKGGKKFGLIEVSENLCAKAQKASVAFTGQNGKTLHLTPKISAGCGGKKGAGKGK